MKVTIETSAYNPRRYGKPWIAQVIFSALGEAEYIWGNWVGQDGYTGELVVEANPGDIVARGQKDHRKGGGLPIFYRVAIDGNLDGPYQAVEKLYFRFHATGISTSKKRRISELWLYLMKIFTRVVHCCDFFNGLLYQGSSLEIITGCCTSGRAHPRRAAR